MLRIAIQLESGGARGSPCVPRGSSAAFSCASARRALLARRGRDVGGQEAREVVGQVGVAAEEARHRRVRLRCARLVRAVRRKQLQEGGVGARLALKGAQKPREGVREEARPLGTRGFGPSRHAAAAGGARLEPRLDGGHEAERVVQRHAAGARLAGRLREWGGCVSRRRNSFSAVRGHNGATERGRAGRRVRPARASQLAQPEAPRGALRPLLSGQPLPVGAARSGESIEPPAPTGRRTQPPVASPRRTRSRSPAPRTATREIHAPRQRKKRRPSSSALAPNAPQRPRALSSRPKSASIASPSHISGCVPMSGSHAAPLRASGAAAAKRQGEARRR